MALDAHSRTMARFIVTAMRLLPHTGKGMPATQAATDFMTTSGR
jgi:hypothetical protein